MNVKQRTSCVELCRSAVGRLTNHVVRTTGVVVRALFQAMEAFPSRV